MSNDFQNRLRKNLERPAPAEHPAPDVLNAYIEKVLTPAEERQVTEHLAACGECREVVFLATDAIEEPMQRVAAAAAAHVRPLQEVAVTARSPVKPVQRVRWWSWALPIAAVLVVAVLVGAPNLLRSRRASVQMAQARHAELQAPASSAEQARTEPAPAAKAPEKEKSLTANYEAHQRPAPAQSLGGAVATPPAAPVERRELSKEKDANQPAQNEVALGRLEAGRVVEEAKSTVAMSAPAPAAADKIQGRKQEQAAAANLTADSSYRDEQAAFAAERTDSLAQAKGASRSKAATLDTKAGQFGNFAKQPAAKKADVMQQWRVTASSTLEHFVSGQWQPMLGDSGAHFVAVTAYGDNVWAAGKNLALYHSPDNGATWERQTLRVKIAADINQVLFTSANDGVLTTNLGTSFETHDGGKSWAQAKR